MAIIQGRWREDMRRSPCHEFSNRSVSLFFSRHRVQTLPFFFLFFLFFPQRKSSRPPYLSFPKPAGGKGSHHQAQRCRICSASSLPAKRALSSPTPRNPRGKPRKPLLAHPWSASLRPPAFPASRERYHRETDKGNMRGSVNVGPNRVVVSRRESYIET